MFDLIVSIIAFICIIVPLVFIHEMGHFITAKATGVKVLEFGIGFPPRLFAFKRGETEYSLNLIPLGGFCKMAGEEDPDEPGSLASKSIGTRLLVLSAGSIVMLLFPILLLSIGNMIPSEVVVGGEGIEIVEVASGSPAEEADIQLGDIILTIDGQPIRTLDELRQITSSRLGMETTVLLLRDSEPAEVTLIPRANPPPGEGAMGIVFQWANPVTEITASPPWEAIPLGFRQSWQMLVLIEGGITSIVAGHQPFAVTSVIGIAQATGEVARGGALPLLAWASFLSFNLGVLNLLPIPALDGGRILFVIIEGLRRGKRISPEHERLAHLIGFALIITLVIVASYFDILRIIRGESLFP